MGWGELPSVYKLLLYMPHGARRPSLVDLTVDLGCIFQILLTFLAYFMWVCTRRYHAILSVLHPSLFLPQTSALNY